MVELLPGHKSEVTCLLYNNSKNYVISSSWDRHTKVYGIYYFFIFYFI